MRIIAKDAQALKVATCGQNASRAAFTMLELLITIAIISILLGLLLPAALRSRERARTLQCKNNMKQMGMAGASGFGGGILAAVGHTNSEATTAISVFRCPADSGSEVVQRHGCVETFGRTNFSGVLGDGQQPGYYRVTRSQEAPNFPTPIHGGLGITSITDGLSNTLNLGEQDSEPQDPLNAWAHLPGASCQYAPNSRLPGGENRIDGFRSVHPENGANFLLFDGSVRMISNSISLSIYHALSTPQGGEVAGEY